MYSEEHASGVEHMGAILNCHSFKKSEALVIKKYNPDEYLENPETYGDAVDCIFPSPASQ